MATLYKVTTTSTNSSYYGILGREMTAEQYTRAILHRLESPTDLGAHPNRLLVRMFSKATLENTTTTIIQSGLTAQQAEDLKYEYINPKGSKYDSTNANTVAGVQHADQQANGHIAQAVADYTDPEGDYNDVYTLWLETTGYEINASNLLHYLSDLRSIQRELEEDPENIRFILKAIKRNYGIM